MTSEELSRLEELANVSFMNDPRWVEDPDFFLDLPNYDGEFIVAAKPGTVLELIALAKWALQARETLEWYAERTNWKRGDHNAEWSNALIQQDCAMYNTGGGRARLALAAFPRGET